MIANRRTGLLTTQATVPATESISSTGSASSGSAYKPDDSCSESSDDLESIWQKKQAYKPTAKGMQQILVKFIKYF